MKEDVNTATNNLSIEQKNQVIERDISRVICRHYLPSGDPTRINRIINRIMALDKKDIKIMVDTIINDFSDRHENLRENLKKNFEQTIAYTNQTNNDFSRIQKWLIGAYFTMEYSIESAALFNPSIVPHPDQSQVKNGDLRFIMSLRAVGEGHISSLVFRSGLIHKNGDLDFDPISSFAGTPDLKPDSEYDRKLFRNKLDELDACSEVTDHVLDQLPEYFTLEELNQQVAHLIDQPKFENNRQLECFRDIQGLANSNYHLSFQSNYSLSERVIFPVSEQERGGIEDARFVKFTDDNDEAKPLYYGTYTAYNGTSIMPQIIQTSDFKKFKISTLNGDAAKNKNLALFPRKINGNYVMLSRQDGENNRIMFSDNIHFWQDSEIIQKPTEPWEFVKIGNCGSPIETDRGWLMLTHGVGQVRTYSIGAALLDLEDPTRLICRLEKPLLHPKEKYREGYVPNVVYTCGAILHKGKLIIPYAMSDIRTGVAKVELDELLNAMVIA